MSAQPQADWLDTNERYLAAEFGRIKAQIAGEASAEVQNELTAAREAIDTPASIDVLSAAFDLTPFERDVLLLCAGVAMNTGLAAACQAYAGATAHPHATFGLALSALEGAHWSALTPIRPLRGSRLVHVHDERALTTSRLSIEERVLHYLVGLNYLDPRLQSLLREAATVGPLARTHEAVVQAAVAALEASTTQTIVQLIGDEVSGQMEVARRIAVHYGLRLRCMRAGDLPANRDDADALAVLWNRESALLASALFLRVDDADAHGVVRFVGRLTGVTFIGAAAAVPLERDLRFRVQRLDPVEQSQLWHEVLGDSAPRLNGSIDEVASQFRLDTIDIVHTGHALRADTVAADGLERALWQTCRDRARTSLDDLAQRVVTSASWQDLVLPEQQIATLRQIVAHARHRLTVYEHWGFAAKSARGLGMTVLFSGESGTGKTMAAEVLANELRLDLFRIDLSSTVSKYIGETEKNLRRLFDAAEPSGAILLFDEADALFGKRSEIRDSHDRYANIEVSYLLQRMEAYRGLAILTTNLRSAIDAAFQRRLQFVVAFPFPDAQLRERIWRGVFPHATPLAGVNPARLAQLNVAGGSIRNIAMNAAFLAADAGVDVGMNHLLQAARSEAAKRDRPFSDAEVRGWE